MKRTQPKTATEKQAAQMLRAAGVDTEEGEAPKRRAYVETGDHRPAERPKEPTASERQAEAILRGL